MSDQKIITTSDKVRNSLVSKTKIAIILKIHRVRFYEKLKYNDWTKDEIKTMIDNLIIK